MKKIRVAIAGYGNLGRGVELAVGAAPDMELVALFTRRAPESVKTASGVKVYPMAAAGEMKDDIDVCILCGGSANDLPEQTPELAKYFNVIDSFDTHARIPEHFKRVDEVCRAAGKVGMISVGWDPGMFSLMRLLGGAVLPSGEDYTFWGRGISQGHSDAIRRIPGVVDARQYTVPKEEALARVLGGESPLLTTREKHLRECYVVAEDGADKDAIKEAIVTMPNYFADYDTVVNFITLEELRRDHAGIPHGGRVIRTGRTGQRNTHVIEYKLKLDSNPEFTASVITAYARATYRLANEGEVGCKTVFDIAPKYLYPETPDFQREHLL